ncbi:MAG: DUF6048 family protein [Paludibacteraceae bacterium]|nr:DUF6048 family protein [Paludibacteraceae bacterium]
MKLKLKFSSITINWIAILILLLSSTSLLAEDKKKKWEGKTFYGVSVDLDVFSPILHLFNRDRLGFNASVQADFFHHLYPEIVVGYDRFDASDEYSYSTPISGNLYKVNGLYMKFGAAYNLWKKIPDKMVLPNAYIGVMYAVAPKYSYEIQNYPIENSYWNKEPNLFSSKGKTTAHWGEIFVGLKTPIVNGLCLGWEVIYKLPLYAKLQKEENKIIHQSYAPGYGDKEYGKWGFRYTISYFFHKQNNK